MAKQTFYKIEFDKLAIDGFIGNPDGTLAYAYIRVSSDEQADEGKSGLPRQIEHIHAVASKEGYRISFDMVFADDFSGFEFEDRPELSKLRKEYKTPQRRADMVIFEDIDRLSRDSDFHQGYLLDDMKKFGIQPIFWQPLGSDLERKVKGIVSDVGMKQSKERMLDGTLRKAQNGGIISKRRRYGYQFVDGKDAKGRIRRKIGYKIYEPEAVIMREVYRRVASGETLYAIKKDFNDRHVPTAGKFKVWDSSFLSKLVQDSIYKGEYVANRVQFHKKFRRERKDGLGFEFVKHETIRDESEWIRVKVDAIVTEDVWQKANEMIQKNRTLAQRNQKHEYLLSGFLKCSCCGYSLTGKHNRVKASSYFFYGCSTVNYARKDRALRGITCNQGYVTCAVLDAAVWKVVCDVLMQPKLIIEALEKNLFGDQNQEITNQLSYLETELARKHAEDEKLYAAYLAEVFSAIEYKEKRDMLKAEVSRLEAEIQKLKPRQITKEQLQVEKQQILALSKYLHEAGILNDVPYELKKRILKLVIDEITVDVRKGQFILSGSLAPQPITTTFVCENKPASRR